MTSAFKAMQNLQAERELDQKIHAHRHTQFDVGSIPCAHTRMILRKGLDVLSGSTGHRISAASTIGGLTVSDCNQILDAYFRMYPSPNGETQFRFGAKMALARSGVLLPIKA